MPCCSAAKIKARRIAKAKAIRKANIAHPKGVKPPVVPKKNKAKGKKKDAPKRKPCTLCNKKKKLSSLPKIHQVK
jgi:hypothetical protein